MSILKTFKLKTNYIKKGSNSCELDPFFIKA